MDHLLHPWHWAPVLAALPLLVAWWRIAWAGCPRLTKPCGFARIVGVVSGILVAWVSRSRYGTDVRRHDD